MSKIFLETENLKKIFNHINGSITLFKNLNIKIKEGDLVALVGPSGCGKSTTLRMIAGLEEISSGDLVIDGTVMNDVAPKDRDIAMVFQNYALYPHMSVYENMAFGLKIRKYAKKEIDVRVNEAAGILDIEELLERKPKALSGGQRQRVAVGRAIDRKPNVFLFDEPLSNLDAKLRVTMRAEISSLHSRLQATMIYVTHDQIEAMTMGDRIVVMRDGLIQQIGSQLGLYNQPVYRFVAGFIGSPPMNIMNAKIAEKDGNLLVDEGNFQIRLSDEESAELSSYVGKDVLLGIRPEDLEWSQESGGENNIIATVEVVEPLGAEIHLYVSTENNQLIARVPPRLDFEVGQKVNLIADVSKVHIFDAESEVSILQPKVTTASE